MDCRSSVRVVFQLDVSTRKEVWFGCGSGEGVEEEGWSLDRPRVVEMLRSPLAVLAAIALLAKSTLYAGDSCENKWHNVMDPRVLFLTIK